VLDEGVFFRRRWGRPRTLRHCQRQVGGWARRTVKTPWAAVVVVLGAMIVGWLVPDLRADSLLAWLRHPDHVSAWTQDVVVLRPAGGAGNGLHVLRPQPVAAAGAFQLCTDRRQASCVIDGDTIRYGGVKIRLADIDTPEIYSPKCPLEATLGRRATERLQELLNAGPFEGVPSGSRDVDRYGRKLRILERHGGSLGDVLIAEGLARRWDGARRSWCG
jgi:endonuclease YncB( thermonuclease family)